MRHLTSKEDLFGRAVGVEQYKPGQEEAKKLAIGVSSGTTKGMPTLIVHNREYGSPGTTFLQNTSTYGKENAILRLSRSAQNTHRLITELWEVKQPKRFLTATLHDMKQAAFPALIDTFAPTQIDGPPSIVIHALTELKKGGALNTLAYLKENIIAMDFAGEKMTNTQYEIIRSFLPKATPYSDYSLSELPWWLADTCPVHPNPDTSVHCISPHFTDAITIHEPDEDGKGEIIVYTKELGNYRTGDLGKIEPQQCACGSTKRLTVLGRMNYDVVPCVGAVFHIDEIDRVFNELKDYIADYLVEVTEETDEHMAVRGKVCVTVVPSDSLKEEPVAAMFIKNAFEKRLFVTPSRVLAQLVAEDIFLPSTITFTDTIPSKNKKIRLQRI